MGKFVRKPAQFLIASALFTVGLIVILSAGLPQRASFTGYTLPNSQYVAPEIGALAPPFTLQTYLFQAIDLTALRGDVVVLNFWGTWCVPCRIEMPELQTLYQQFRNDGLHILAINLGESPQTVAQWVEEYELTYDVLLDPLEIVAQQYQIRGQPSTYVISRDGYIAGIYYGAVNSSTLEYLVADLLST